MYIIIYNYVVFCFYLNRALALFLASIGNPSPSTINGQSDDGVCRPKFSVAIDVFQSTAMPVNIYQSNLFASTARQGAGLLNVYEALTTTVIFSPSQLALNDTIRKATSYKVKLWNIGAKKATYTLRHSGAALATGAQVDDDQLLNTPVYSAEYAVSFSLHISLKLTNYLPENSYVKNKVFIFIRIIEINER